MKHLRLSFALGATLLLSLSSVSAQSLVQTGAFMELAPGTAVQGSMITAVRSPAGVSFSVQMPDLKPGYAYTNWLLVFDPTQCADNRCTPMVDPPVSMIFQTGQVVPEDGAGNFGAYTRANDMTNVVLGPGLTDPIGAQLFYAVRNHGPVLDGRALEQTRQLGGGCDVNTCMTQFGTILMPNADPNSAKIDATYQASKESLELTKRLATRHGLKP